MSSTNRNLIVAAILVLVSLSSILTPTMGSTARILQTSSSSPINFILFYDDYPSRGYANYQVTPTIARPLVSYIDQNGNPTDWMFDSFIFYSAWLYYQKNPTQQYIGNWTSYLFDGMQIANLDATVGGAKVSLNQPNYQMTVFLSIPVSVDNFTVPSILNNVNSLMSRWNSLAPRNLKLVGFYWGFTEDIYSVSGVQNIIPQVASYVHSLGLKMLMIPYQWPGEYNQLHSLGFDYVTLQPNYAFHSPDDLSLFTATNNAITAGYVNGAELELSFWVKCCTGNWLTNLQTYFQQANQYQWYAKQPTVYYHGSDISTMARSSNSTYRAAYNAIYQYIVSTRTAAQNLGTPASTSSTSTTTASTTATNAQTTTSTTTNTTQAPPLPLNSLATEVLNAPADSASIIFPDYSGPLHSPTAKCGHVYAAQLSDYSAGGYIVGLLSNSQNQFLDTSSSVSQSSSSCGNPTGVSGSIVTLAGPGVNLVAHYYEQVAATSPVYFTYKGANSFVVRATGQTYSFNTVSGADYFVIEAFTDSSGRKVFMLYGFSWQGTLAAAYFLNTYVRSHLSEFANSWYIYQWKDASTGMSHNSFPDQGDQYIQVATG